jgi:uroporphyrinogen-III synthase
MGIVITTRPLDDALFDSQVLAKSGVACLVAPMVSIKPLNVDLNHLFETEPADAVALTSRHAVGLMARTAWASKTVYCVGESTARLANDADIKTVITGPGDGLGLADLISTSPHKTIFWPSAVDVGFDLAKPLSRAGVTVFRHPVYKADKTNTLPDNVITALRQGDILAVMVHSGRAGAHLVDLLHRHDLGYVMTNITAIAISSRVAGLCGDGWHKIIIADAPRRSAMLDAAIAITQDKQQAKNQKGG